MILYGRSIISSPNQDKRHNWDASKLLYCVSSFETNSLSAIKKSLRVVICPHMKAIKEIEGANVELGLPD